MTFNVSEFRSQLIGDGARPNLFAVTLTFPTYVTGGAVAGQKTTFMAKAASLPASTLGIVPQYYFGREVKLAGNRTFGDWALTIINDEDFAIRNALENWSNAINSHKANLRSTNAATPTSYTVDALVTQYGKTGNILKTYNFIGMFPTNIDAVSLDWGSNDSLEEYGVTFAYQWWESNTTT